MLQEFRKFILRGNVIDLAVGIIIGAAFTAVVQSLVNDIIMPPIGYIFGGLDFSNIVITLGENDGVPVTMNIGLFINNVISLVLVGFAVFMLVRFITRLEERFEEEEAPEEPAAPPVPTTEERLVAVLERLENKLDS